MDTPVKSLMTTSEAAAYLRIHEMTLYRWLKTGKFKGFKLGGRWRINLSTLEALGKDLS